MPGADSYTKLLLHCKGADASTAFEDFSPDANVIAANGNAQIDTDQFQFGDSSVLFDGTGDYLSASNSSSWDFGNGDFTIDFWIRRNGSQSEFAGVIAGDSGYGWAIHFGYSGEPGGSTLNKIRFVFNQSQASVVYSSDVIPDLTWTHVAFVRYGNYLKIYINGTESGSVNISSYTLNSSGTGLTIGRLRTNQDLYYFSGWMDEIRVSKGIARWTSNFTPPTIQYTPIDLTFGGTPTASSQYNSSFHPQYVFDKDNITSRWNSDNAGYPQWVKYDFGSGNAQIISYIRIYGLVYSGNAALKDYKIQGSNDDSNWDDLATLQYPQTDTRQDVSITNSTAYRYYRMYITSSWTFFDTFYEWYLCGEETEETTLSESFGDSLSLSDSFNIQQNPDSQSLNDSIIISDSFIIETDPDSQSLDNTLSLHDDFNIQTNPDNQSISDSLSLSDSWNINVSIIITNFQTKLYTALNAIKAYSTDLRLSLFSVKKFATKLYTQLRTYNTYNTDLRVRLSSIDNVTVGTLSDFIVKLDGSTLPDVDYTTLVVNLALNTSPSTANFTLARRHDDLNKTLSGATSTITNENKIEVFDGTTKLFTGYISQIDAESTTDTVKITASDCRLKMSRASMELKYGGAWQADSNHNGVIDEDDTTEDIPYNRPDYIKFEKNINTAFVEVMTAVGSLVSGYDALPFSGSYVPEYVKSERNYTELIDELIRQTANCNWYIDENERLRFQKVGSGSIKELPLASLNSKRHPYDLIVDNIQLNRPSSSYAKSLVIKRGKDLKDTYHIRNFQGWTNFIIGDMTNFWSYNVFYNSLKEKNMFVWYNIREGEYPAGIADSELYYSGMDEDVTFAYSIIPLAVPLPTPSNRVWWYTYPSLKIQWVDRILNKVLPDITVGSGLPKKTVYFNSYGKRSSNGHYVEEVVLKNNPNSPYVSSTDKNSSETHLLWVTDENYDQTAFCLDLANFELSQNNIMNSSANLTMLLDAYKYYNLSFMDLVNLSNTIQSGIYKNSNGFPLNIESVTINCSTRTVNLNLTNYGKSWYAKTANYLLNYTAPRYYKVWKKQTGWEARGEV